MNRLIRILVLITIDVIIINAVLYFSFWLRFDGAIPGEFLHSFWQLIPVYTLCLIACLFVFGLHSLMWEYAGIGDLLALVASITSGTLLTFILTSFSPLGGYIVPGSIFFLCWAFNILFVGFSRVFLRIVRFYLYFSRFFKNKSFGKLKHILIVGAGEAGNMVVGELRKKIFRDPSDINEVVGFVDDDPRKQGQKMHGLPVLGKIRHIPALVKKYGVEEVIIAIPSASGKTIQDIVDICYYTGVKVRIVPGLYELIDGKININQIREVNVNDLLNRDPVKVDLAAMSRYIKDRVVVVTGAGGSIGSELSRQLARLSPLKLLLIDMNEDGVYNIHSELSDYYKSLDIVPIVADVKDERDMADVFRLHTPKVVFHAAAYKHVPLMEENPARAVKNNILGTWVLTKEADKAGVEIFVLVSTDKAVDPCNIMGATKRVSEILVQKKELNSDTCFSVVRFGNVLNSRGSVVPLFKKQIERGGPVTVTHPEMTRYFMTIPEAVQLIIQAGTLCHGGEVFILDMGSPVKIMDLAEKMIKLAGFKPGVDIDITIIGIRPGEKLSEDLFSSTEESIATDHERIFMARNGVEDIEQESIDLLINTIKSPDWHAADLEDVVELLKTVLISYSHEVSEKKGTKNVYAITGS